MKRRDLLKAAIAIPFLPAILPRALGPAWAAGLPSGTLHPRVRPGQAGWPSTAQWDGLKRAVGGRLIKPVSPFGDGASSAAADEALKHLDNPYYLGDQPALTQTSGWADAWTSQPSAYAVVASNTADVVAAVDFARKHRLRLVVKGGGHSYQGTSDAPDSLLVWTRHMNDVTLHNAFVAQGCAGR